MLSTSLSPGQLDTLHDTLASRLAALAPFEVSRTPEFRFGYSGSGGTEENLLVWIRRGPGDRLGVGVGFNLDHPHRPNRHRGVRRANPAQPALDCVRVGVSCRVTQVVDRVWD